LIDFAFPGDRGATICTGGICQMLTSIEIYSKGNRYKYGEKRLATLIELYNRTNR
jgi:hypothetical protein